MSIRELWVDDAEGRRQFALSDLPLKIGTASDCELRLPGPASTMVASLDTLDGAPFLQAGTGSGVTVNGETLSGSRRLADGDEVGFYGSRIRIALSAARMSLRVELEDSAYVTRPPEVTDSDTGADEEAIAPTTFRRAAEVVSANQPQRSRRWQIPVAIAIAALGAVSYTLFTAKSIQFDVQPVGADSVVVRGGWFRLPLADRILLREGDYTVEVRKEGYYDVAQPFVVDERPSATVAVELRRLPGFLTVLAAPDVEAMVTVNEQTVGPAPLGPIELEPGTHSVRVTADRYLPYRHDLSIAGLGRDSVLDVQLVPQWADVEIRSEPENAAIYQGEREIGRTPMQVEFMEGKHEFSVVLEGYKAWDGVVEARANEDQTLPVIELEPANAALTVNSIPRAANVSVNGRYRGQSPIKLALSPDVDYEIGLSKAGYGDTTRTVRLRSAAAESITVDLSARVGRVTINAQPADAEIVIDGRVRGSGTVNLDLSSAPHQLEVKKDGYETFARSITPRPGYPQTVQVRLLSDEEVRRRSVSATLTTPQQQTLRRVEPGSFSMGASRREQGRRANEVIVPVTLTRPYFIGEKEVTNAEFLRFKAQHDSGADVHASLAGNNNPVVNVTWAEAVEYCNWLSAEEGLVPAYEKRFERWEPVTPTPNGYRLPTEAEWVWAVRYQGRANATRFPWGDRLPPRPDSGNYADQSARELVPTVLPGYEDGYASTAPVGSFPANALGLFDGGGNVAEWVQDYYSVPQPGQTSPVVDPTGPRRGAQYVIRGSSWRHGGIAELRYSYRDFSKNGRVDVGFRIARNAE